MDSKTEKIEIICSICGKAYSIEIQTENSCKDDFGRVLRSFEQVFIERRKCDSCIEKEDSAKLERQKQIELDEKLRSIPFSTDFNRGLAPDKGVLSDWVWTKRQNHLFIAGDYGCGKTRSRCHNLGQLTKQGRKCRYITCNDLLSKYGYKSSEFGKLDADGWLESLLRCDILAIDDLGKKRISLSGGEALYNLLDYRYSGRGRATIYLTANLSGGEIVRKFEDNDTGAAFRTTCLNSIKRPLRLNHMPIKKVSINKNNVLIVNEAPVFPMGIYHVYTKKQMKQIRQQGFNCIQVWSANIVGFKRKLDLAEQEGLMGFCVTKMLETKKLKKLINALKNHPANLMWDLVDEPAIRNITPIQVKEKADIIRSIDNNRPIKISFSDTTQAVKYEKCLDIVATHCYPIPFGKVTDISKRVDLLSKDFAGRVPTHFTPQSWLHYNDLLCV